MQLTADQVLALAPDASSAAAGRKLGAAKSWRNLGHNDMAVWGECQGSALYHVRADLTEMATKCSCPSRKFPCKHSLGLLLVYATTPDALPEATPPEWVQEWLAKRTASAAAKVTKQEADKQAQVDPATANKRAEKRLNQVMKGIESLDLWMNDLIRNGLASLETQPSAFWENQAARMVDAQAPGIAARLRAMAAIPNASPDWPEQLLAALGRLALLTHAFRRIEQLDPALQLDVRQAIGWNLKEDEVIQQGERVSDTWFVLGQRIVDEERLRIQRTWLHGAQSGRNALVMQFSAAGAPFGETFLLGTHQQADLHFWPGAAPQRALIRNRQGNPVQHSGALPGLSHLELFFGEVATVLARQPWQQLFPCIMREVTPVAGADYWSLRDQSGAAITLAQGDYWRMLALSGGAPLDLMGEWDGSSLTPLAVVAENVYYPLEALV